MPSRDYSTQMLRDDLLAQLRASRRALTTTQLRHHAARPPVHGAAGAFPPIQEQIYRVMRGLENDGLVTRVAAGGRTLAWELTPAGAADEEIAALEEALRVSDAAPDAAEPTRLRDALGVAVAQLKAVADTARRAAASPTPDSTAAAADALSHVVVDWVDVLTVLSRPEAAHVPDSLIEAAIHRSAKHAAELPDSPLEDNP